MNNSNLNYKIHKYTHKLKHAQNRAAAEVYQNKLQQYHGLMRTQMSGGALDPNLEKIKYNLEEQKKLLESKITEISKVSGVNTQELAIQLDALNAKIAEIREKIKLDEEALKIFNDHTKTMTQGIQNIKPSGQMADLTGIKKATDEATKVSETASEFVKNTFGSLPLGTPPPTTPPPPPPPAVAPSRPSPVTAPASAPVLSVPSPPGGAPSISLAEAQKKFGAQPVLGLPPASQSGGDLSLLGLPSLSPSL